MRRHILLGTALASIAALATGAAKAAPMISIEVFDGVILIGATGPTAGALPITLNAADALFNITVTSTGIPLVNSPDFGTVSTDIKTAGAAGHVITILATQTGATANGATGLASTFGYDALNGAAGVTNVIGSNFIDAGNTAFVKTTQIGVTPNDGGQTVTTHGPFNFSPIPGGLFSETEMYTFTFSASAADVQTNQQIVGIVPEPASLALLGVGLLGLGFVASRKHRV